MSWLGALDSLLHPLRPESTKAVLRLFSEGEEEWLEQETKGHAKRAPAWGKVHTAW